MTKSINENFVDIDFNSEAQRLGFQLGDSTNPQRLFADLPRLEDTIEVIPESQWKELATSNDTGCCDLISRIFNQSDEPSCTSNATCLAYEIVQGLQFGLDKVIPTSPITLYSRVGSPSSGSDVMENLKELTDRGVLPLDTPENRSRFSHVHPHTGYLRRFPSGWEETAIMLRANEAYSIRTKAEGVTALIKRWPVVYGRRGHAICGVDLAYMDGGLFIPYANSWGHWGSAYGKFSIGFGFDSLRLFSEGADWAFALRSVQPCKFHLVAGQPR